MRFAISFNKILKFWINFRKFFFKIALYFLLVSICKICFHQIPHVVIFLANILFDEIYFRQKTKTFTLAKVVLHQRNIDRRDSQRLRYWYCLIKKQKKSKRIVYFTFAEEADDLQGGDSSDYTDNALENLIRVAQKWVNYLTCSIPLSFTYDLPLSTFLPRFCRLCLFPLPTLSLFLTNCRGNYIHFTDVEKIRNNSFPLTHYC